MHGASYLIEFNRYRILFDTGPNPEVILHNMRLLNIEPSSIDYIVISHSHYDHTGGLKGLLDAIDRKIPVIAHLELFKRTFVMKPRLREIGCPYTREEIMEKAYLYLVNTPLKILDKISTTGEIRERFDFEKISLEAYMIKDGNIVRDPIYDDLSLCIDSGDGMIIVSGCSHAGIASIVRRCREIMDIDNVKAVLGGFHLIKASGERIRKTIEWLQKLNVAEAYTGHCTGLDAEAMLKKVYKDKFHKIYSGLVIEF